MTLTATLPKPSGGTAQLARARAELATLMMRTASDAGILDATELQAAAELLRDGARGQAGFGGPARIVQSEPGQQVGLTAAAE
jgi:hypothetical protein